MSVTALTALLEQRYGLRFDTQAAERLRRVLAEVPPGCAATPDARAAQLAADPAQLDGLVDDVTLQESSFFRDPEVFADLATRILPAAVRAAGDRPLTVWSVGCAHGQEPYSVAMLLAELGVEHFTVVASELSAAAAARARAGRYTERELRGLSPARRKRFLGRTGSGWRVDGALRARVRVVHHNAAFEAPVVADRSCALVLCQHVLMYVTPVATRDLLARLATAIGPDGRLVVGQAEALWPASTLFVREPHPHAVAYRLHADPTDPPASPASPPASPAGLLAPLEPGADGHPARRHAPTTRHADTGEPSARKAHRTPTRDGPGDGVSGADG